MNFHQMGTFTFLLALPLAAFLGETWLAFAAPFAFFIFPKRSYALFALALPFLFAPSWVALAILSSFALSFATLFWGREEKRDETAPLLAEIEQILAEKKEIALLLEKEREEREDKGLLLAEIEKVLTQKQEVAALLEKALHEREEKNSDYLQLRRQFEEKQEVLDQTRKELFGKEAALLFAEKREEEKALEFPEDPLLFALLGECEELEAENCVLMGLVDSLSRSLPPPVKKESAPKKGTDKGLGAILKSRMGGKRSLPKEWVDQVLPFQDEDQPPKE